MVLQRVLTWIRSSLRRRSLLPTSRRAVQQAPRRVAPGGEQAHPFDLEHGVETGGLLGPEAIGTGHPHDGQATAYFGSQPSVFHGLMSCWIEELRAAGECLQDFTFVDIGCGKGRVLMLASEFPFRQVVGVESSALLVRAALANLALWNRTHRACADIRVVEADVLEYPPPVTPTLLFMYHPFEEELFGRWVSSLPPARSAPLYFAYLNPVHEQLLARMPWASLLWTGEVPFTAAEAAVHLFRGTAERVSLYRLTPPGHESAREYGFRTVPARGII